MGYDAGEISHIENALASESSMREHDRRHRTQVLVEDETTTETFTENQSIAASPARRSMCCATAPGFR